MSLPSAQYSMTMRVHLEDSSRGVGQVTTAVGDAGGSVTAVDIVDAQGDILVADITVNAADGAQSDAITAAVEAVPGAALHKVSDRTFLMHLGGKLEVRATSPIKTRDDLSMAYTPGVARVCQALVDRPEDARRLTIKRNTVAVVTDGSAVLGLGDIGATAALPVMEGKATLFKEFADVDAWPVCIDSSDPDEIVRTVQLLAPVYGGVNLEDIAAPRCFKVEERLQELLDIPVFHDDQHGTAIVVLGALRNALRLVGKRLEDARIVMAGAGAAGVAILQMLQGEGVEHVVVTDREGIVHSGRSDLHETKARIARTTNSSGERGTVVDALEGADVFIGVAGPDLIAPGDLARMARDPIVFALANPDPEVDPVGAREHAAVLATGRSDQPNQINNVLAFPGIFRGALDAQATRITPEMKLAAARALAGVVPPEELRPSYIVPSVFNPDVAPAVAEAVRDAAPST
ncbi:NAD-dependent malic enzyme [Egibacter rhizosphaerae]|uniref:NAD-dependent malic enzyme n=1 Tax=Egibacter rhizosphaerae TaxID=1670831 RepID=A0A411YL12_9ACTN|nr:NAD-dependent malic enzyme [Egibacter rhizosphaerae]QBI21908.1 NAD-dependent malic enzyme [Egibacter rhizosphaerae]